MVSEKETKLTDQPEKPTAKQQGDLYFFPEHGVTVIAKDREEAHTKMKEKIEDK